MHQLVICQQILRVSVSPCPRVSLNQRLMTTPLARRMEMAIAPQITIDTSTRISSELAAVALELQRCTVQVRSRRMSTGSGVIWNSNGLIITNAHVAQDERLIVELSDGRILDAVRTAIDPKPDLAALSDVAPAISPVV
ncbi:MAG: S1C family serine protease [Cyanobacteriota bacterium]